MIGRALKHGGGTKGLERGKGENIAAVIALGVGGSKGVTVIIQILCIYVSGFICALWLPLAFRSNSWSAMPLKDTRQTSPS